MTGEIYSMNLDSVMQYAASIFNGLCPIVVILAGLVLGIGLLFLTKDAICLMTKELSVEKAARQAAKQAEENAVRQAAKQAEENAVRQAAKQAEENAVRQAAKQAEEKAARHQGIRRGILFLIAFAFGVLAGAMWFGRVRVRLERREG